MSADTTIGIFFAEGIHDAGYRKLIDANPVDGFLELMHDTKPHLDYLDALALYIGDECDFSYPGVFHYEVVSPLGHFWANHIIETGELPPHEAMRIYIRYMVAEFFGQGLSLAQRDRLISLIHNFREQV